MTATTEGIHWLGHDSFRIDGPSTVYIDPWKIGGGAPPADLILVTHDHYDHLNTDDITRLSTPATTVIGPAPVTAALRGRKTITVKPGDTVTVGAATVTAVPAYNIDKFRGPGAVYHPRDDDHVGYIVDMDGRRVYHAGDTDAIPEMAGVTCDVALVPVSGTFVMTADEAAAACDMITAGVVVPIHYGDFIGGDADAARLKSLCSVPVEILPLEKA